MTLIRRGWYGLFGGAKVNVFVDGDLVATIGREATASIPVAVGTHVLEVDEPGIELPRKSKPLELSVQADETVVLEMIGGELHWGDPKLRIWEG